MRAKASTPKFQVETCQLIFMYRAATQKIYNVNVFVPKSRLNRFLQFEKSLIMHEMSPSLYTTTTLTILQKWVKQKGLDYVPINVFLGKWAMERFLKVYQSQTVEIMGLDAAKHAELLHSELLVARAHMKRTIEAGQEVPMDLSVGKLKSMLSQDWLQLYRSGQERQVTSEALDIICYELKLRKKYSTYKAIAEALLS